MRAVARTTVKKSIRENIMTQSKRGSALEITCNYASGFVIALLVYKYGVRPFPAIYESAFLVTTIFTVVSVVRSYVWRRLFNAHGRAQLPRGKICPNCDSTLPGGCGGAFLEENECLFDPKNKLR